MTRQDFPTPSGMVAISQISKPRAPRYHSLDHWRGLACLMIVLFHASIYLMASEDTSALKHLVTLQSRVATFAVRAIHCLGWGVPIFFVISGYCIAATVDSSRRKAKPARNFFARRFRRIYPPFWIFL